MQLEDMLGKIGTRLSVAPLNVKEGDDSGTTSEETMHTGRNKASRTRQPVLSRRRRVQKFLKLMFSYSDGLTPLERAAVTDLTTEQYQREIDHFVIFLDAKGVALGAGSGLDGALVDYMNHLFLSAYPAHRGEKLLAGICHKLPEFGRFWAPAPSRAAGGH